MSSHSQQQDKQPPHHSGARLTFANTILSRIKHYMSIREESGIGFLYGTETKERIHVVGCAQIPEGLKSGHFVEHFARNRCVFPVGVDPVGIFLWGSAVEEASNIVPMGTASKIPEQMICLHGGTQGFAVHSYNRLTKELQKVEFSEVDDDSLDELCTIRLCTTINITYPFSTKKAELQGNCTRAVRSAIKSQASPAMMYEMVDCDIIVGAEEVIGAEDGDTVQSLLDKLEKIANDSEMTCSRKRKQKQKQVKLLCAECLEKVTQVIESNVTPFAPVIEVEKEDELIVTVCLPISALVMVSPAELLTNLPGLFQRATSRQLEMCLETLVNYELTDIPALEILQYQPVDSPFLYSILTTKGLQDSETMEWRRALHERFLLPMDRPCFRQANRYKFPQDMEPGNLLTNPHIGLQPSGVSGGTVKLVQGKYNYHHYMQDKFNDGNWGCAYRSLQTLVSWFNLQGYSNVAIPTHRDIQQVLVDMGDKEPPFVGSKEWIGSTEVSYVLDKLLNVSSRIQFVSSGAEMESQGRELLQHFERQGTPIMIGGGVLAHTILGVHYNDQTGQIKFLILDPHYTGGEDIHVIQDKGWCGWKGPEFWDAKAYYNMCMPQRPKEI